MNELERIYNETGETSHFLPVADKKITFKDLQGNEVKKTLSGDDYSSYQKQLGQVNYNVMEKIIDNNIWNNLTDEQKLDILQSVKKESRSFIDERLFNKPNWRTRALYKKFRGNEQQVIEEKIYKKIQSKIKKGIPLMVIKELGEQID